MSKYFLSVLASFLCSSIGMAQTITTIKGYAPEYIGKTIEVNEITDFLSQRETKVAITTVKEDSTFSMSFENTKIQKVVIRSNNNSSYIYIEPGKTYELYLPLHDKDKPYRSLGNYVTSIFLNLDSNDINQKVIDFDHTIDRFYALNLYEFVRNKQLFLNKYKVLKDSVYKSSQTESEFYKGFVHYSFADLDMSIYNNEKALRYIFDTYIDKKSVQYDNENYFLIIKKLYSKLFSQLDVEVNNRVYMAVLKKSPSLIMKALEEEYLTRPSYTLKDGKIDKVYSNEALRELVMIYGLAEAYDNPEFPKTNIIEILDSISRFPQQVENGKIAANIAFRLTQVTAGNPSPNFALLNQYGKLINLKGFENTYIYFHIFKPNYTGTAQEIELLKEIYQRYSGIVKFVSVYTKEAKEDKKITKLLSTLPWDVIQLDEGDPFYKTFNVQSYPYYILIDRTGVVVAAPALSPIPDGEYMTIDKTFYDIQRMDKIQKEREEKRKG